MTAFVRYVTSPAAVVVPKRVRLGSVWITQHPLEDPAPAGPGFAHLTYAGALEAARAAGGRLPTRAEIVALHEAAHAAGTELAPCILPDQVMRAAGYVPGDPAMLTREWCERHDREVLAAARAVEAVHEDAHVANAGKHWIAGAPPGLAALCGWWSGGGFIQSGLGFPHNDAHTDYSMTTLLVFDSDEAAC